MMKKSKNKTVYRAVCSVEVNGGNRIKMYGIEGKCGKDKLVLTSLSSDRQRIYQLVKALNDGEFELCLLKDVVNDFLFECYGVSLA